MKGHKEHHRKAGGKVESAKKGVNEAEMDLKMKPMEYNHGNPMKEAEEMHAKHGGRAKRKNGGKAHAHHEGHVKHVGKMEGEHASHHAGRKPRKAGGRAAAESNPFTTARHGTAPKGHKVDTVTMG
jgi:hypothetical protein